MSRKPLFHLSDLLLEALKSLHDLTSLHFKNLIGKPDF